MSYLAEQNVIGALFLDPESIDSVYSMLSAEMFTSELLGRIYLEFQRGYDNRYEVNQEVICQKLQSDNFPERMLVEEIRNCILGAVTSANIKTYTKVVVNDYKAACLNRLLNSVKVLPDSVDSQIGKLISDLEVMVGEQKSSSKTLPEIARENKGKYFLDIDVPRLNLGLSKLDDLLGGLEGGDVIVIGARPAVGKSAFVTQIASSLSGQGKRVGFYNLEMQEKQIYERFLVAKSGIGMTRIRRAKRFLGDEKERFDRANETLESMDNIIITTGSRSVSEIRHESRHMKYDVIIIDYLQLLKTDKEYRGNRYAEVGAISKAIKAMAMEFNIPIIALSQLNRVSEMKETKEPTMAELREAGDIEQDASVIILLWNLSQDNRSKKGCKVEKQRQGQTGKVVLDFNGDLMQFEESDESIKDATEWVSEVDDECPFK